MEENNRTHKEVVEDICDNCHKDCTLKEIILDVGLDDRTLEQIKCIETFGNELSDEVGGYVGMGEASKLWVERGYADRFAEVFKEGMRHFELYHAVVKKPIPEQLSLF